MVIDKKIIQGGMGAGVSNWRLAGDVSRHGQLGVVSGTALDTILVRRLQDGDSGGHMRRALRQFPFSEMAERIIEKYFVQGGKDPDTPYKLIGLHTLEGKRDLQELCIAANFVEVRLAKEGHNNPVGINFLEKIQFPHLPSIYGAMLAGVDVVIMGAGIPMEIPGVLDALATHSPVKYPIHVEGAKGLYQTFDPSSFREGDKLSRLLRPDFFPIIASASLGKIILKRANGKVQGFVAEGETSGGHNAPPRGTIKRFTADGQPIYGEDDILDLAAMRALGVPFWLAGSYGSHKRFEEALAAGATGVQVGTAFAYCNKSGLDGNVREEIVRRVLNGEARVFTDPLASPTGYPFKVTKLKGSLSEKGDYDLRDRVCDLGYLRIAYLKSDGSMGYRCPAEPVDAFVVKGGEIKETVGRKCLCNGLMANIGLPQRLRGGDYEKCLVTSGDDLASLGQFCTGNSTDYSPERVINVILGKES